MLACNLLTQKPAQMYESVVYTWCPSCLGPMIFGAMVPPNIGSLMTGARVPLTRTQLGAMVEGPLSNKIKNGIFLLSTHYILNTPTHFPSAKHLDHRRFTVYIIDYL